MRGRVFLLFCVTIISASSESPLHVFEIVDANGGVLNFELFMRDLDAPANAVAMFCRHTRACARAPMHACARTPARGCVHTRHAATPGHAAALQATPCHATHSSGSWTSNSRRVHKPFCLTWSPSCLSCFGVHKTVRPTVRAWHTRSQ